MDSPASTALRPGPAPLRVCLATPELEGFGPSSGLGSLVASIAESLAEGGWEPTVLLASEKPLEAPDAAAEASPSPPPGVRLVSLPEPAVRCFAWPRASSRAYKTYRWLREHAADFDRVVFCDRGGLGYYALLAKHQGLAFERLPMGVLLHSPTLRRTLDNAELVEDYELLIADFLERESARLADGVAATSGALLRALRAEGWSLPEGCRSLPPPLPASFHSRRMEGKEPFVPEELVFFGSLESRKRLRLFCDAIDRLSPPETDKPRITLLGRSGRIEGRPGKEYVTRRVARWPYTWECLGEVERGEALGYLGGGKRLAVIGSTSQGLPLGAWECASLGIPFLCAGGEGVAEILPETERERLVAADPHALAARLREALNRGVSAPRPPADPSAIRKDWSDWLADIPSPDAPEPRIEPTDPPKVTVCLVHHDRPALLAQALASLRAQDYPNFEVVLVDDGSSSREAAAFLDEIEPEFAKRGWRIVRQPNLYVGAARNRAAREAKGEFLLFMDDDNLAEPHEISTFVRVALRTGAAILTSAQRDFEGVEALGGEGRSHYIFSPLGPSLSLGVLFNFFGDANAFVRRKAFEALGGFSEERGVAYQDWELFAKAVLAGFPLETVPEPLFWYRRSAEGMMSTTSDAASWISAFRPYRAALLSFLSGLLLLTRGKLGQVDALWRDGESARREAEAIREEWKVTRGERDRVESLLDRKQEELRRARDELSRIHRSRSWRLHARLRQWEQHLRKARKTLLG